MSKKRSRPSAVVLDTNILVRAFLSGNLGDDRILQKILDGQFELVYSRTQLREFTAVLGYRRIMTKYSIDMVLVEEFLRWIVDEGKEGDAEPTDLCRDPSDNHILGVAVRVAKRRGVYLVTGDRDILALKHSIDQVTIVTPGEFLKRARD